VPKLYKANLAISMPLISPPMVRRQVRPGNGGMPLWKNRMCALKTENGSKIHRAPFYCIVRQSYWSWDFLLFVCRCFMSLVRSIPFPAGTGNHHARIQNTSGPSDLGADTIVGQRVKEKRWVGSGIHMTCRKQKISESSVALLPLWKAEKLHLCIIEAYAIVRSLTEIFSFC